MILKTYKDGGLLCCKATHAAWTTPTYTTLADETADTFACCHVVE